MSTGRLLILDDDPAIGRTIAIIAEGAGLSCIATADPTEFFSLIESFGPSHIALDLVMPQMDGVEVMERLASLRCSARIIVTSGLGSRVLEAAARTAADNGLDLAGILAKPFSPAKLRALLADAPPAAAPAPVAPAATPPAPDLEALRQAVARQEFFVVYQPKVRCADGSLAGFEALLRWRHPALGVIGPDQFIPLAESSGLIDAMTEWMLDDAITWFAASFADSPVTLAINLSAVTASNAATRMGDYSDAEWGFVEHVLQRCQNRSLAPSRLIFELTESSAMSDPAATLRLLTRMRMKGFQLSIDDFGTGFSSMLQLVRLPFSEIKVDRSFVGSCQRSEESRSVVRSIVNLGESLGLTSTGEGVEDEETLEFLRSVGCDLAQGYLIARPMPAAQVVEWAASRRGQR